MHKDTRWAKQIIALQQEDGSWGDFHSLSQLSNSPITTEQALRRLERLGYTLEDDCIQRAVSYMNDCLIGKVEIPDRKEKLHDWNIFTSLMLATRIRVFTKDNVAANKVAEQWAGVITGTFINGEYDYDKYVSAYYDTWGVKPRGGRLIDCVSFYQVSLLADCLEKETEKDFIDYVINKDSGIYYIYDKKICILPQVFESRHSSYYLTAIELLSEYKYAKCKIRFVINWLNDNKNENGKWDMGKNVNDKVYFPLSDNWRKKEMREADCTERISNLISKLSC
ncbi:hypothetical protein [Kineothrix sp. MB12-C1]|uniref:hypothetical protein n=1 Tax=Kineothrix sp. MB12-C1 TaxID=3070215 RepID=UPI0027D1F3E6|nr:hypothetical protein [Kineothrix sp. MB12-C1]WMC91459.1 hypothetical protein RBB56_11290 [Kineothrix sp. MB12-C1]